jgi:hypothetical protein
MEHTCQGVPKAARIGVTHYPQFVTHFILGDC